MTKVYSVETLTREVLEQGVKLRVIDTDHSRAFQRACFDLGVFWEDIGDRERLTPEPYLLVQAWRGKLSLRYVDSLGIFNSHLEDEIYFDDEADLPTSYNYEKGWMIESIGQMIE